MTTLRSDLEGARILTVRQPWAEAILFGGKDVENRMTNIAGDYRGPVAIQSGLYKPTSEEWNAFADTHSEAFHRMAETIPWGQEEFGVILGVVDLVDVHLCIGECSPWALPTMTEPTRRDWWHLELANPRALAEPIPYRGALGLRRLDDDTIARIAEVIA